MPRKNFFLKIFDFHKGYHHKIFQKLKKKFFLYLEFFECQFKDNNFSSSSRYDISYLNWFFRVSQRCKRKKRVHFKATAFRGLRCELELGLQLRFAFPSVEWHSEAAELQIERPLVAPWWRRVLLARLWIRFNSALLALWIRFRFPDRAIYCSLEFVNTRKIARRSLAKTVFAYGSSCSWLNVARRKASFGFFLLRLCNRWERFKVKSQ